MSLHANISIFVPHLGCPKKCSFCNQNSITGQTKAPTAADIDDSVRIAAASMGYIAEQTEIAFFGGSFTAIDRAYMCCLLESAFKYVKSGIVGGIRISTRPDAIDEEVLDILKGCGVTAIELGAQSMDEEVLKLNNRGHSVEDVINASQLIKSRGFSLGLQMMTGLYGDTPQKAIATAQKLISLNPETVRIYPTVILKNTALAKLYKDNKYLPQTLQEATDLCAVLLKMFYQAGIKVIRLGLHTIEEADYVAGPWHPSMRELCEGKIYLEKALQTLETAGEYIIYVNKSAVSKMVGQKRCNIEYLKTLGFDCRVAVDNGLSEFEVITTRV
ncbi:MAG: radical SAM protein [Oscillospiraceae bacterium]